ncbi:hypothetical protein J4N37_21110 [Vibrio sp. SCSIO 43153]|uniref:hypothetical protein n=1 Tax=Vibrio sp. SCSIO 43153 TaxID=2819098 RepID=UPI002075ADFB|nr:hypothetical protein [Vibrio sp. SCSIO 43153]USD51677.1 hypothetical protein J4N37_21110 [Vibrio sp. SCSIO 43153]
MKTRVAVGLMGLILAGCSTTTPTNVQVQNIETNCTVIMSEGVTPEQRWNAYNKLIESYGDYYVDNNNRLELARWNSFRQKVIHDESGQLIKEFVEVSDWGCANGNYLEEMYLFVKETQASNK